MPKCDTNVTDLVRRSCGITSATRVWVGGHNIEAKRELEKHLHGTKRPPTGLIDVAFVAPASVDEGIHFAGKLRSRFEKVVVVWVVLTSPRGRHAASIDFPASSGVQAAMSSAGFVSIATVAISENWEAMRFDSKALPVST